MSNDINELFADEGTASLSKLFKRVIHLESLESAGGGAPVVGSGFKEAIRAVTTTYSIIETDFTITADATAAAFSVTLPDATDAAYYDSGATPPQGSIFQIVRINSGANVVTVATTGGQTINGLASVPLPAQWDQLTVQTNGSNWIGIM